jgi:hypothetical protein
MLPNISLRPDGIKKLLSTYPDQSFVNRLVAMTSTGVKSDMRALWHKFASATIPLALPTHKSFLRPFKLRLTLVGSKKSHVFLRIISAPESAVSQRKQMEFKLANDLRFIVT